VVVPLASNCGNVKEYTSLRYTGVTDDNKMLFHNEATVALQARTLFLVEIFDDLLSHHLRKLVSPFVALPSVDPSERTRRMWRKYPDRTLESALHLTAAFLGDIRSTATTLDLLEIVGAPIKNVK
jgi:hypothetical protein